MSIDAIVKCVHCYEDGSGYLELEGADRGQPTLSFDKSPEDISALNGQHIWGGASSIMHGHREIAKRQAYTQIVFTVNAIVTSDRG